MTRKTALSLAIAVLLSVAGGAAATSAIADGSAGSARVATIPPRCC